ncbi:SPL family radical SAM protein [Silvibacterium dinghuense]|uniref:Radical SAM protein n=1 Tax=Silvibacterium dinghuense TaxID=1560006 RepID=A0A4Q1SE30_9BACT|nr:radical SAM protein [Silvibacterium dinghuense]RXS95367.1 radical SAM protein [Silvibacterium dinghuense]GGH12710.1 radical SAM protein [Silvibacterium dinghuense]
MSEEKAKIETLFPILGQGNLQGFSEEKTSRLSGIARLAAQGSEAGEGYQIEFRTLPVRSLLNHSVSKRGIWFAKSINPYRGCEFACRYCYARYTHEFLELRDPADFERKIFIKENARWLLEQELAKLKPGEEVALGTATDPYQPIERRARVTRGILEVFAKRRGLRLGIVTKSTLIERDIDVLTEIACRHDLVIHMTITTADAKLARILEPRAPRPDLRFQTVKRLREARLRTGVLCSPLLPGITDHLTAIEGVARRAKEADASFFSANPLFLKPCSKGTFLEFVKDHFPQLLASYERRYATDAFTSEAYQERLRELVRVVRQKYGLGRRTTEGLRPRDDPQGAEVSWQGELFTVEQERRGPVKIEGGKSAGPEEVPARSAGKRFSA